MVLPILGIQIDPAAFITILLLTVLLAAVSVYVMWLRVQLNTADAELKLANREYKKLGSDHITVLGKMQDMRLKYENKIDKLHVDTLNAFKTGEESGYGEGYKDGYNNGWKDRCENRPFNYEIIPNPADALNAEVELDNLQLVTR